MGTKQTQHSHKTMISNKTITLSAACLAYANGLAVQSNLKAHAESQQYIPGISEAINWTGGAVNDAGKWFEQAGTDIADWTVNASEDVASWTVTAFSDVVMPLLMPPTGLEEHSKMLTT